MAFVQNIPAAPGDAPPQTRQSLQAIISVLNQLTGTGAGRSVTRSELVGTGSFSTNSSGALIASSNIVSIPLPITNFTATGAWASILLAWNAVSQAGYSHVEVWRSLTNDISTASYIGSSPSPLFSDVPPNSATSVTYYYWVRAVNINGIVGPFNAVSGTAGSTSTDPSYALEVLTGQVTSTQLHQDLTSRINLIDAAGVGLVDTTNAMKPIQESLQASSSLSADSILANAVALQDQLTAHFANKGNIATITTSVDTIQTDLASEVTQRTLLEVKLNASTALYSTSSTAAANALSAVSANTTSLQAQINTNVASISTTNQAITDQVATEAGQRTTLQAAIIGTTADPSGLSLANITSGMLHEEKTARVSDVGTINTTLQTIQGAVNVAGSINYAANQAEQNASTFTDNAIASSKSALRAEFNSIKSTWSGAADPSLTNYIHYGDIWFDATNKPSRWVVSTTGTATGSITSATKANPVVITSAGHSLVTGDRIQIESVGGMVELNLKRYIITVIDTNSFSLNGIDGTAYTAFSASGTDIWERGEWSSVQDQRFTTVDAAITNEATTRADADQGIASTTDTLLAGQGSSADAILANAVSQNTATGNAYANVAAIRSEQNTRVTSVQAQADRIDTLVAGFVSADGSLNTALNQVKYDAIATADSAAASRVATLQTTVNGNTASIQTQSSSINGLEAQYTIKTDVNGKIAGFGLANTGNANPSAFEINADRFVITPPTGGTQAALAPFAVDAVAGKVLMNGASIMDATITNAKIASLAADKILAGNIIASIGITTGNIKTGNATGLDAGTGVWIGNNAFRAGDPLGNHIKWNGSSLTVQGVIKDTNGNGVDSTKTVIDGGLITTGGISSTGTGFNSGSAGFFLGHVTPVNGVKQPRFFVGNPAGDYMSWDGSSMVYRGNIDQVVTPGTSVLFSTSASVVTASGTASVNVLAATTGSSGTVDLVVSVTAVNNSYSSYGPRYTVYLYRRPAGATSWGAPYRTLGLVLVINSVPGSNSFSVNSELISIGDQYLVQVQTDQPGWAASITVNLAFYYYKSPGWHVSSV